MSVEPQSADRPAQSPRLLRDPASEPEAAMNPTTDTAEVAAPAGRVDGASTDALQTLWDEEQRLLRRKGDGLVVLASGVANVIMQLSWPEIGYGVVESKVESGQVTRRPFKRFRTTVGYLGVALFGNEAERANFAAAINSQHRQVRSTPQSPVKYNAFNRDLQLWVASCLYYGLFDTMTAMHGPLSGAEHHTLLRASARLGTTLHVPQEMWHKNPEEFEAYWETGLERVSIDPTVGAYLLGLLRLTFLPKPLAWVAGPLHAWLNTGFLPPVFRDQLRLPWTERDQRRHNRLFSILGRLSRPLPKLVRAFPINAMRRNLALRQWLGRPLA